MGKASPTSQNSATKKNSTKQEGASDSVLMMMERLSTLLIGFRKRENLDQKQMAELMSIGQSRYNEIEKLRNLNPEFGVSLAFLLKFAELEKTNLSSIAAELQNLTSETPTKREKIDEGLLMLFSGVKLDSRIKLIEAKKRAQIFEPIPDYFAWWVDLGLDLFSMDEKEQLEFEMRIHQLLLKEKNKSRMSLEQRRERLTTIMRKLIELS